MTILAPQRMTVDEFLAWSVRQEKGRYELQDGRVIMQQAQNWGHARLKWRFANLLASAIARTGAPYFTAPDGMTVRIGPSTAFEPDALVAPLPEPDPCSLEVANPVIVVEVLSPSSVRRDLSDKVAGYFQVRSIVHYLVLDPEEREIIWHRRAPAGGIEPPAVLREGTLQLDPPGIEVAFAEVFEG